MSDYLNIYIYYSKQALHQPSVFIGGKIEINIHLEQPLQGPERIAVVWFIQMTLEELIQSNPLSMIVIFLGLITFACCHSLCMII